MKLKGLNDYDICNYKEPSMFLIFPYCSFKCDEESGQKVCQNSSLVKEPIIEISTQELIQRYLDNPLTKAIVCGGLEPFDSYYQLWNFIYSLRKFYNNKDYVVIYTGYTEDEISSMYMTNNEEQIDLITDLSKLSNVIIKFGRFIPNQPHHFDDILGVELASPNQYAKLI